MKDIKILPISHLQMAEKKYKGAPFGIQTARFDVAGVHPKSKSPGTYTQIPYCRKAMDELVRCVFYCSFTIKHDPQISQ